jgi:hypothetical protein
MCVNTRPRFLAVVNVHHISRFSFRRPLRRMPLQQPRQIDSIILSTFASSRSIAGLVPSSGPFMGPWPMPKMLDGPPNKIQFNGCRRIANLPQLHAPRRSTVTLIACSRESRQEDTSSFARKLMRLSTSSKANAFRKLRKRAANRCPLFCIIPTCTSVRRLQRSHNILLNYSASAVDSTEICFIIL